MLVQISNEGPGSIDPLSLAYRAKSGTRIISVEDASSADLMKRLEGAFFGADLPAELAGAPTDRLNTDGRIDGDYSYASKYEAFGSNQRIRLLLTFKVEPEVSAELQRKIFVGDLENPFGRIGKSAANGFAMRGGVEISEFFRVFGAVTFFGDNVVRLEPTYAVRPHIGPE